MVPSRHRMAHICGHPSLHSRRGSRAASKHLVLEFPWRNAVKTAASAPVSFGGSRALSAFAVVVGSRHAELFNRVGEEAKWLIAMNSTVTELGPEPARVQPVLKNAVSSRAFISTRAVSSLFRIRACNGGVAILSRVPSFRRFPGVDKRTCPPIVAISFLTRQHLETIHHELVRHVKGISGVLPVRGPRKLVCAAKCLHGRHCWGQLNRKN